MLRSRCESACFFVAINKDSATPMQDVAAVMKRMGLMGEGNANITTPAKNEAKRYTYESLKQMSNEQVKSAYAYTVSQYAKSLKQIGYTDNQVQGYLTEAMKTKNIENQRSSIVRLQEEMGMGDVNSEGNDLQMESSANEAMGTRNKRMAKKENAPKPGQKISSEEHETFRAKMKELNFDTVGFESYCGDTEVLGYIHQSLTKLRKDYADVLGEKSLKIRYVDLQETDTFAMINKNDPNTIRFNKRIYDDTAYLKAEYQKYMELGYFVKGTDYRSVAYHEMGHVLNRLLGADKVITRVIEQKAKEYNLNSKDFLEKYISGYSSSYEESNKSYPELLPELLSGIYVSNNSDQVRLFREMLINIMNKLRS